MPRLDSATVTRTRILRFYTLAVAALVIACLVLLPSSRTTADDTYDPRYDNPHLIYGNRPDLVNNIVLTIDDNVYEANIRRVFNLLQDKGLKASFFPHTRYMKNQDPQLWRDIVAAGHDIGYFTRNHAHGLSLDEFKEDFALYQDELRVILGDPNFSVRYAKPACWAWESPWFAWLEQSGLIGVKTNILGPAPSLDYMSGVFNNVEEGGHIISIISFTEHIDWLEANIDELMTLTRPDGQPYVITSISNALND